MIEKKKVIELRDGPGDGLLFNVPSYFFYYDARIKSKGYTYEKDPSEKTSTCLADEVFIFAGETKAKGS